MTGHFLSEEDLELQSRHAGSVMESYQYENIPGIDLLTATISDPILVKQVSSVAHQFGRHRTICETNGAAGWNMSFADQKWSVEWQYVLGINQMVQHLQLYSLRGCRKRDYPPSFSQQPWSDQYKVLQDHFARLACALTSGKFVADVLVIHPIESAWCEMEQPGLLPDTWGTYVKSISKIDRDFKSIGRYLQEFHEDYDYGDESIMEKHASVVGNRIKVGQCTYKVVIVPSTITLRKSTVEILKAFSKAGGRVIICGDPPTRIDGAESPEIATLLKTSR